MASALDDAARRARSRGAPVAAADLCGAGAPPYSARGRGRGLAGGRSKRPTTSSRQGIRASKALLEAALANALAGADRACIMLRLAAPETRTDRAQRRGVDVPRGACRAGGDHASRPRSTSSSHTPFGSPPACGAPSRTPGRRYGGRTAGRERAAVQGARGLRPRPLQPRPRRRPRPDGPRARTGGVARPPDDGPRPEGIALRTVALVRRTSTSPRAGRGGTRRAARARRPLRGRCDRPPRADGMAGRQLEPGGGALDAAGALQEQSGWSGLSDDAVMAADVDRRPPRRGSTRPAPSPRRASLPPKRPASRPRRPHIAGSSASSSCLADDPEAALEQLRPARELRETLDLVEPGNRLELPDLLDALVAAGSWRRPRPCSRPGRSGRAASTAPGRWRSPPAAARSRSPPAAIFGGALTTFETALARARRAPGSVPERADAARVRGDAAAGEAARRPHGRRSSGRSPPSSSCPRHSGRRRRGPSSRASAAARPSSGELTATERRVAALAAEGPHDEGGRRRPLRLGVDGREAPHADLLEARRPLARRARTQARRRAKWGDLPHFLSAARPLPSKGPCPATSSRATFRGREPTRRDARAGEPIPPRSSSRGKGRRSATCGRRSCPRTRPASTSSRRRRPRRSARSAAAPASTGRESSLAVESDGRRRRRGTRRRATASSPCCGSAASCCATTSRRCSRSCCAASRRRPATAAETWTPAAWLARRLATFADGRTDARTPLADLMGLAARGLAPGGDLPADAAGPPRGARR